MCLFLAQDPASFLGKFIIDMYYGTAVTPQKVDIVVIRNDNKTNVKTIKANVTTFPTSIQVTGTELTTLFDSTIKLGDKFEIGADVTTTNGQKFEAFPFTGNPYGADTTALPGSRFSIVYVADCKFDISNFNGNYIVQQRTWDFYVGDFVTVSPGTGNTLLILAWPKHDLGLSVRWPMVVNVDPVTYEISIPYQTVGEYIAGPTVFIEGGTGTVSPCGDRIYLVAQMWVDPIVYGPQILDLKKWTP